MASCRLWLLQAKEFPNDERSREARRAEFYLKPGTYTVGRSATQCDIAVIDDPSISRLHAELEVTSWSDEKPSVLVKGAAMSGCNVSYTCVTQGATCGACRHCSEEFSCLDHADKSRYGTLVSPVNSGLEAQGCDKEAVAYDGYYIKVRDRCTGCYRTSRMPYSSRQRIMQTYSSSIAVWIQVSFSVRGIRSLGKCEHQAEPPGMYELHAPRQCRLQNLDWTACIDEERFSTDDVQRIKGTLKAIGNALGMARSLFFF